MKKQIKSSGGSTPYYDLPSSARDIGDLIEAKQMSFNIGNIFKACYRLGIKDGIDQTYDLNKIVYFAQRELEYVRSRGQAVQAPAAQKPYRQRPSDTEVFGPGDPIPI